MIGCLRTRVRKQPIIALYFESENELKLILTSRPASSAIETSENIEISLLASLGMMLSNKGIKMRRSDCTDARAGLHLLLFAKLEIFYT